MRINVPTAGSRNMCWTIKYKWHLKTHQRDARCSIRSAISRLSKSTAISWAVLPLIVRDKSAPAFRSISAMSKWPTTVSYLYRIWTSNIAQEAYTYSWSYSSVFCICVSVKATSNTVHSIQFKRCNFRVFCFARYTAEAQNIFDWKVCSWIHLCINKQCVPAIHPIKVGAENIFL